MMALMVGALLAVAVGFLGTRAGLERDRAFYPVVTLVVAHYYVLFAAMGADTQTLVLESQAGLVFLALAVSGFKASLWMVAAALAAHGLFDLVHGLIISNPGVPRWWPRFCLAFDVTIAAYLAWLLRSGRLRATA
jgi:hypothetical protein